MYEITEYEKQTKEDAYIEFRAYSWKDKDREGVPHARRETQRFIEEAKEEGLSLDARNLMVKFVGGNLVCIWKSEWGGIRNEEMEECMYPFAVFSYQRMDQTRLRTQ